MRTGKKGKKKPMPKAQKRSIGAGVKATKEWKKKDRMRRLFEGYYICLP